MNTMLTSARRVGATLAIAGVAALGSVVLAPAAAADDAVKVDAVKVETVKVDVKSEDGSVEVIHRDTKGGPDMFIVLEKGRVAVFFCDEDKPKKQHKKCETPVVVGGPRF